MVRQRGMSNNIFSTCVGGHYINFVVIFKWIILCYWSFSTFLWLQYARAGFGHSEKRWCIETDGLYGTSYNFWSFKVLSRKWERAFNILLEPARMIVKNGKRQNFEFVVGNLQKFIDLLGHADFLWPKMLWSIVQTRIQFWLDMFSRSNKSQTTLQPAMKKVRFLQRPFFGSFFLNWHASKGIELYCSPWNHQGLPAKRIILYPLLIYYFGLATMFSAILYGLDQTVLS